MALAAAVVRQRPPELLKRAAAGHSLRAALVGRAIAGDAEALTALLAAIPAELPAAVVRDCRDRAIRELGGMLGAMIPGISPTRLARLIAEAGAALDLGHVSAARALPMLTNAEVRAVDVLIREALSWLPIRWHAPTRWPAWRQIYTILSSE
jgi:hypothetical protein